MFYAAREGNTECCELLIRQRCDINHRDVYGQTPLFFAIKKERTHTSRALYLQGAQLDVNDNAGRTPAWYCTEEMSETLKGAYGKHIKSCNVEASRTAFYY